MGRITIGTSSWADPGFVEEWYPQSLPARDRLAYYAERFDGVEVNATWYAIPAVKTVDRWAEVTPDGFTFDVKLHRLLSRHSAGLDALPTDLREVVGTSARGRVVLTEALQQELAQRTLAAVAPLEQAGKLSSFLLQLSPSFTPERHALDELAPLVQALAPTPVAIELRHVTWLKGDARRAETFAWLREHRAAFVGVDVPKGKAPTLLPRVDAPTHPQVAYLRAHGRDYDAWARGRTVAERFAYRYADDELEELGARARRLAGAVEDVRLQFNTNRGNDAPVAAARMRELLGQEAGVRASG